MSYGERNQGINENLDRKEIIIRSLGSNVGKLWLSDEVGKGIYLQPDDSISLNTTLEIELTFENSTDKVVYSEVIR